MRITTQLEARTAHDEIAFCYLCGNPLPILDVSGSRFSKKHVTVNEDHVPPRKMFANNDRNFPIKLRVHKDCNGEQSPDDQKFAELMRLLWGTKEEESLERLKLQWLVEEDGRATVAAWAEDLPKMIFRWIRGFHAALYRSYLPDVRKRVTLPPFTPIGVAASDERISRYHQIAATIWKNRDAGRLDEILCYNSRCRYQCTWNQVGHSLFECSWCLDINGWTIFNGLNDGPHHACLGAYYTPEMPGSATQGTSLHVIHNNPSLDLFPDQRDCYIESKVLRKDVHVGKGVIRKINGDDGDE